MKKDILTLAADTIRILSAEAVQKANSGHPGMPMGCADFATVLWTKYLNQHSGEPAWLKRDRFILSAGHGSMLLYSLLHLSGYKISLQDIKNFRQWGAPTAGHPELDIAHGIETTTGPLGQGFAMGVGMALANKMLTERFPSDLVSARIFAIAGDGCMMEGITHEAASLAGHLKLGNIIYFYDSNSITIEGSTSLAFSDNVKKIFEGYGWLVITIDAHNHKECASAIEAGIAETTKPTLIIGKTHIAFSSPNKQDSESAHGAPLGEDEVKLVKEKLGFPANKSFYIPDAVKKLFLKRKNAMQKEYAKWKKKFDIFVKKPENKKLYDQYFNPEIKNDLTAKLLQSAPEGKKATRAVSGAMLQTLAEEFPGLIGGSADLAPSNNTHLKKYEDIAPNNFGGRNIRFGVREFAMSAISNGISIYGGFIPYCGTFLIFSDYMRPAMRLSALMKQQVIYILTHDSFFVGEDGPTHQPVEQIPCLRAIPNMTVFRPAGAPEVVAAYIYALKNKNAPTVLSLTRQGIAELPGNPRELVKKSLKGAYTVADANNGKPEILLIATGSEVALAIEVKDRLEKMKIPARVVSMPSREIFEKQSTKYKEGIIPPNITKRVTIEAAAPLGWEKYAGTDGLIIAMERFGASAPGEVLKDKFGFNANSIIKKIKKKWL